MTTCDSTDGTDWVEAVAVATEPFCARLPRYRPDDHPDALDVV
jgi:hypothetical protein